MSYDERYPLKDYLNTINQTKQYLMDEDPGWEKNYPAYVINKCMSQHMDTIMYANEMNQYQGLDKKLQYDFFINIVRPRKRFSPWGKKQKVKILNLSSNIMVTQPKKHCRHCGFYLLNNLKLSEIN